MTVPCFMYLIIGENMRTIEKEVYSFNELDGAAKEKAREWFRGNLDESDFSAVVDDVVQIGVFLGIEIEKRTWTNSYGYTGKTPCIYWDLYRRECAVDARYAYAKNAQKEVHAYVPLDNELKRIAEGLQAVQKRNFYHKVKKYIMIN